MSLINDALKRAKAAQQPVLPAPKVDLRPVSDPAPAPKHGSRALLMAVLGVFLMATLLVIRLTGRNSSITANAASPAVATSAQPALAPVSNPDVPQNPANAVVASPSPSVSSRTEPQSLPPQSHFRPNESETRRTATPTDAPVATVENESSNAAATEVVPPRPPAPKLQAIVFSPTRPSAIINGRTVFIGDKLGEARVIAIDQESATLLAAGQTNVLTLPQ